ncbi:hypothetical protein VTJ83DRAFT_5703 [Remersonia thermophila]|uniref:VASt domain-containing protein n=1 Tax=Remersonia thermophila TaxID=72144 RepID=A0ABR4D7N7_9PEZI
METTPATYLPTTEAQRERPRLLLSKVPSKAATKYGRCDWERFDNVTSTPMSIGHRKIGKVEVNYRFLFTKSQWGVIGPSDNPGGILYLDLDIRQPKDYGLSSATITVTLTKDDEDESFYPVQFTSYYGPKNLCGEKVPILKRKIKSCVPEAQAFGFGGGGLGMRTEKVIQTQERWQFSGHTIPTKGSCWSNQLRWDLKENSFEAQPMHSNQFNTAFALEHNATKFYMSVHITGKLVRLSDTLKKLFRFGGKSRNEITVTKIQWSREYTSYMKLDDIARGLDAAMQEENMANIPVEVSSGLRASFHDIVPAQDQAAPRNSISSPQPLPQLTPSPQPLPQFIPTPRPEPQISLQAPPPPPVPRPAPATPPADDARMPAMTHSSQDLSDPIMKDLMLAAAGPIPDLPYFPQPPPQLRSRLRVLTPRPPGRSVSEGSDVSSSVTLANPATPRDEMLGGPAPRGAVTKKNDEPGMGVDQRLPATNKPDGSWLRTAAVLLGWFEPAGLLFWVLAGLVMVPLVSSLGKWRREIRRQLRHALADNDDELSQNYHSRTSNQQQNPVQHRSQCQHGPEGQCDPRWCLGENNMKRRLGTSRDGFQLHARSP